MLTAERPRTIEKKSLSPLSVRLSPIARARLRMVARRQGVPLHRLIVTVLEQHAIAAIKSKPPAT